ncbi:MAG: hypothetical protein Q8R36_03355 [bacterium]|nr:hypothetical protein [bacterium]
MNDDDTGLKEEQPGRFLAKLLTLGFAILVMALMITIIYPPQNLNTRFIFLMGPSVLAVFLAMGNFIWHENQYAWMVRRLETMNDKKPSEKKIPGIQPTETWPPPG